MEDNRNMISISAEIVGMDMDKAGFDRMMVCANHTKICFKRGTPKKLKDLLEKCEMEGRGVSTAEVTNITGYKLIIPALLLDIEVSMRYGKVVDYGISVSLPGGTYGWKEGERVSFWAGVGDHSSYLDSTLVDSDLDNEIERRRYLRSVLNYLEAFYGEELYRP